MKKITVKQKELSDIEEDIQSTCTAVGHGAGRLLTFAFPLMRAGLKASAAALAVGVDQAKKELEK
ncbi:MAG: hypothetical protein CMJ25_18390 [Phycisphaerae bacterium]|nr:hypothetical protein [Phycisphaerae bacterium]|tara:strand:+ start:299 stop:493 length:195 start_codon:yes stop_codon:yes gene_type:complete